MSSSTLMYIALPIVGTSLIVFALGWGWRLGTRPIELGIAQLGFNLKADLLTLLVLLGFVTTLSGAFLFYKDYQSQLTILNQKLADTAMQVKNIQELQIKNIQEFQNKLKQDMEDIKNYNVHLGFVLIFPERIDEKNINILKKTPGETSWALTNATPSSVDTSKKTFTASLDLNRGDRVKIIGVGSDQQLKWTSGEIEVPNVVVEMRKSE